MYSVGAAGEAEKYYQSSLKSTATTAAVNGQKLTGQTLQLWAECMGCDWTGICGESDAGSADTEIPLH